jgi:hypothetical protein
MVSIIDVPHAHRVGSASCCTGLKDILAPFTCLFQVQLDSLQNASSVHNPRGASLPPHALATDGNPPRGGVMCKV